MCATRRKQRQLATLAILLLGSAALLRWARDAAAQSGGHASVVFRDGAADNDRARDSNAVLRLPARAPTAPVLPWFSIEYTADAAPGPPMAMRYCAYTAIPDRYGADMFKQAKENPELMKMFANSGCKGGAYGGNYVVDAFKAHGFAAVVQMAAAQPVSDDWSVLWTQNSQSMYLGMEKPAVTAELRSGRRIHNHCTLILYAGDKCALARHMQLVRDLPAIRARGAGGPSGLLRSYLMNDDDGRTHFAALATMDRTLHPEAGYTHMMKPCVASGASGQLFYPPGTTLADLTAGALGSSSQSGRVAAVMQEYVASPFLWQNRDGPAGPDTAGGVKFHLRLYLLVTSYSPMRLTLCQKGLVLRASQKYSYVKDGSGPETGDQKDWDPKMHLTNTKINAAVPLSLEDLWRCIADADASKSGKGDAKAVWRRIKELSAKLLCTHELSTLRSKYRPVSGEDAVSCFDVFGLDVILDDRLVPWVMEINEGPDMVIHEKWPVEQDAKSTVFDQVSHWLHNLLESRTLTPGTKQQLMAQALRSSSSSSSSSSSGGGGGGGGHAVAMADIIERQQGTETIERWWALYLEHSTLTQFDRIYPVVSDQFGGLDCAGETAEGEEDCTLTTELCGAPDRAADVTDGSHQRKEAEVREVENAILNIVL